MASSAEIRRLTNRWNSKLGWPKRLEWLRIKNIRRWTGQRIELNYPIVAVVGENGVGKSTVLQAAASVYRLEEESRNRGYLPTDFFPDTAWEKIRDATIEYSVKEGE